MCHIFRSAIFFGVDVSEIDEKKNTTISGRLSLHLFRLLAPPLFRTFIINIPSFGFAFHGVTQWHSGFWFLVDYCPKHTLLILTNP